MGSVLVGSGYVLVRGGEWMGSCGNRGAGNTRKSGFYIERGRDGVRMG